MIVKRSGFREYALIAAEQTIEKGPIALLDRASIAAKIRKTTAKSWEPDARA